LEGQAGTGVAPAKAPARSVQIKSLKPSPLLQIRLAVLRLAVVLALISTVRYFVWRVNDTMNPVAVVFFWVFLIAEMLNFVEACMFYFIAWKPTRYATPAPLEGRTVDIYIATYNEPVDLLRETIVCALNVSYPHNTYVLDDGCRGTVEALAKELGADYIARKERDRLRVLQVDVDQRTDLVEKLSVKDVPALIDAVKSKDENLRGYAVSSLKQIGPAAKDAIPALKKAAALEGEKDENLAAAAKAALKLVEKK